jgi:hypothetical protein
MIASAAALALAIVAQDQTALRAAPHDNATRQTILTAGDWLEVRGEEAGYLQVYDHRHERPGYVRPAQVRRVETNEASAPALRAVVDFLRDSTGQESLGIGYVALYLKAAPSQGIDAGIFDALGAMAQRLAERASAKSAGDARFAEQLQVAESYGVHFQSFEGDGGTRVCYDGEAFKRVLALGGSATMRVRAALGLTDPRCADAGLGTTAALELETERETVLGSVSASAADESVTPAERARLHVRSAIVHADLAYYHARSGAWPSASVATTAARRELARADARALADEDRPLYDEAAIRTAATHWAAEPAQSTDVIDAAISPGEPGQTCVRVQTHGAKEAPSQHCSFGVVWPSSLRVSPNGNAVAVSITLMPGWTELVVWSKKGDAWAVQTMPPALVDPDIGYAELAGFEPDGSHLLVVREYRASGPLGSPHTLAPWLTRTFQVVGTGDAHVEREVRALGSLPKAKRWETADWKRTTLALR